MARDEEHGKPAAAEFEERVGLAWGAKDVEIDPALRRRYFNFVKKARAASAPASAAPADSKQDTDER